MRRLAEAVALCKKKKKKAKKEKQSVVSAERARVGVGGPAARMICGGQPDPYNGSWTGWDPHLDKCCFAIVLLSPTEPKQTAATRSGVFPAAPGWPSGVACLAGMGG